MVGCMELQFPGLHEHLTSMNSSILTATVRLQVSYSSRAELCVRERRGHLEKLQQSGTL
jgi:hypothetical protein